jgi:hypothetical protein
MPSKSINIVDLPREISSSRIRAGENFLLEIEMLNDDSSPIAVASLSAFEIRAKSYGTLLRSWIWLPADAGDPHIVIVDGLATLEVEASDTAVWCGTIDFEVLPSYTDIDYFVEGVQVDVIYFPDLLEVTNCLP